MHRVVVPLLVFGGRGVLVLQGKVAVDANGRAEGPLVLGAVVLRGPASAVQRIVSRAVAVRPQRMRVRTRLAVRAGETRTLVGVGMHGEGAGPVPPPVWTLLLGEEVTGV